jgi:holo-[acyl-carrier protein] synthase
VLSTQDLQDLQEQRFAAKEACRKACVYLGSNTRGYQSIIILPVKIPAVGEHQSVRPLGLILDAAYENRFGSMDKPVDGTVVRKSFVRSSVDVDELDGQLCEISISHDGDYATASAIVPYMDARVAAKRGVQRQRSDVASTSRDLSGSQREEEEAYW